MSTADKPAGPKQPPANEQSKSNHHAAPSVSPAPSVSAASSAADAAATANDKSRTTWVCVGNASHFGETTPMVVHSRRVTILRLRDVRGVERWTCLDSTCYHAGGPLTKGDITHVDGRVCVRCPWHSYLVDVFSGDGLYQDLARVWQTKGVRQRVHDVEVRDAHVFVRLREDGRELASDVYAFGACFGPSVTHLPHFPDW